MMSHFDAYNDEYNPIGYSSNVWLHAAKVSKKNQLCANPCYFLLLKLVFYIEL